MMSIKVSRPLAKEGGESLSHGLIHIMGQSKTPRIGTFGNQEWASLLGTTFLLTIMDFLTNTARAGQDQDTVPVELRRVSTYLHALTFCRGMRA